MNPTTSLKRLVSKNGTDFTFPKGMVEYFNKFLVNVVITLASNVL